MSIKGIYKFIQKNLVSIIFLILLLVPFFWFRMGELDLGGDSSRLYFLDPLAFMRNVSSYSIISLFPTGDSMSLFYMLPFLVILSFIKTILLNSAYLLNCVFYGFLLAGGFLFFYLSMKELFVKDEEAISWIERSSFILASLFFVLSPINFFKFQNALLYNNQTIIYPFFVYLFLRFLKTVKYKYLLLLIFVCFVFSVNLSINVIPWFAAFFIFFTAFIILYAWIEKKLPVLLRGGVFFLSLFLLTQFFQLIPQIYGIMDVSSPYNQMLSGRINDGLQYFESVRPYIHLFYNLGNQDQYGVADYYNTGDKMLLYEYGAKYLSLFLIYPILIIFGILNFKKNKNTSKAKKYWAVFCVSIVLLFFMTANVGSFGVELYRKLFDIPGFSMFRSYYTKFNFVFTFFYALLFGYSLVVVLNVVRIKKIKAGLSGIIFCLIIFNSWPFLSGSVMSSYRTGAERVRSVLKIDDNYMSFLNFVKNKKIDGKYLSFPLTGEEYVVVRGNDDGAYVGPSMIGTISGKSDFVGLGSFSIFKDNLLEILKNRDVEKLKRLNSILNIGYVVHNSDDYIYDRFSHPYTKDLKSIFPDQKSIADYIKNLNYQKTLQVGDNFNLYSAKNDFLPHFYTAQNSIISNRSITDLPNILSSPDWQTRSAIFFAGQNVGKEGVLKKISNVPSSSLRQLADSPLAGEGVVATAPCADEGGVMSPTLEFKKIDPTKYRIRVHGASGVFPLVFSESFNDGWKSYLASPENLKFEIFPLRDKLGAKNLKSKLNDEILKYKTLDGNSEDQATKDELQNYLDSGYVTTLGPSGFSGKPEGAGNKEIRHMKWVDGKEVLDYVEKYNIDFVSKNFQGTIQNDNLPNGNIFETWFRRPIENNNNHLMANGYANSWVIDTSSVCDPKNNSSNSSGANCVRNADGSYDFEMVVEFWPQRLFYVGLAISLSTLLGCIVYLGHDWRKRKKSVKME